MKVEAIDRAARDAAKAAAEAAVRRETREAHRSMLVDLIHQMGALSAQGVEPKDINIEFTPEEADAMRRCGYLNYRNRVCLSWTKNPDGSIAFVD